MARVRSSGDGLHQASTGARIVIIVAWPLLEKGNDAQGRHAQHGRNEAEAAARSDVDQFSHGTRYTTSQNRNGRLRVRVALGRGADQSSGFIASVHTTRTASFLATCSSSCWAWVRPSAPGIWPAICSSQAFSSSTCFSIGSTPRPRASTLAVLPEPDW